MKAAELRPGLPSGLCHFKLKEYQESAPGETKKPMWSGLRPMPLLTARPGELEATFL